MHNGPGLVVCLCCKAAHRTGNKGFIGMALEEMVMGRGQGLAPGLAPCLAYHCGTMWVQMDVATHYFNANSSCWQLSWPSACTLHVASSDTLALFPGGRKAQMLRLMHWAGHDPTQASHWLRLDGKAWLKENNILARSLLTPYQEWVNCWSGFVHSLLGFPQ